MPKRARPAVSAQTFTAAHCAMTPPGMNAAAAAAGLPSRTAIFCAKPSTRLPMPYRMPPPALSGDRELAMLAQLAVLLGGVAHGDPRQVFAARICSHMFRPVTVSCSVPPFHSSQ